MPGLRAPSDYSQEPARHPALKINAKEPFNAEPPRAALVASYVTPYRVSICGLVEKPKQLSMDEIRSLPKYNIVATLQCAGNRRTAMSKKKTVKGVGWDVSALGNAVWGGAKLADVLELVGIPKLTATTPMGAKHVEFISVDRCKEENGGPYKASIPLRQATNPEADVLLAYEMNGEVLNRDHGYPLRVVVPGVIGARSVKWLDCIEINKEECQVGIEQPISVSHDPGFFHAKGLQDVPPTVNWDNINWSDRKPQMDFPVQSAICSLEDVDIVKQGKLTISGYAVSGGGRGIERVDISLNGGKTWVEAHRYQRSGVPYVSDDVNGDKWAWVLFKAEVDIPDNAEIVVKAVDSAANVQPETVEEIWNLRGILNTSWHRIRITNALKAPHSHL
ncbi:unnamed protein product [Spirodela intermedia]|uniref:Sulfite oxidase n=1 Tax=Spirodela intermedia TaxID=51605 RepID=A0A7I8JCJ9_SPIIN|nr:unnamed protein product [Spirodela intermedia]CAA6667884.1 unnamed protein product [Spirodela intermedia]